MAFLFAYSSGIKYYLSLLATDCQRAFQVESIYIQNPKLYECVPRWFPTWETLTGRNLDETEEGGGNISVQTL
jgi:hypothetical protein